MKQMNAKYIVKVSYTNGATRTCPFDTKKCAKQFANALAMGCNECQVEIIENNK